MTLIFNASPLIVLAKAGLLDRLIPLAAPAIWVPQSVATEISMANDPADSARAWIEHHMEFIHPDPPISNFVVAWDLGAGESSVISLAQSIPNAVAVLDDLAARRCAQALGLSLTGTLGLILKAKRTGIISAVGPCLDAVSSAGLFITPAHLDLIRRQAGEMG